MLIRSLLEKEFSSLMDFRISGDDIQFTCGVHETVGSDEIFTIDGVKFQITSVLDVTTDEEREEGFLYNRLTLNILS